MSQKRRQTNVPKNWQMSGFISTTLMSGRQVTTCWCPIVLVYILGLEDFTDPFPCWKQTHRFSAEQHLQMRRTVPPGRAQAGGLASTRRYQLGPKLLQSRPDPCWLKFKFFNSCLVKIAKCICPTCKVYWNSKKQNLSNCGQTLVDVVFSRFIGPFGHCFLISNVAWAQITEHVI